MKKTILTAVLFVTVLFALAGGKSEKNKMLKELTKALNSNTNLQWKQVADYRQTSFMVNDQSVYVYYDNDGNLICFTKKVTVAELPEGSVARILKKNTNGAIDESLMKIDDAGFISFYATVKVQKNRYIYKINPNGHVRYYNKMP